MKTVYSKYAYKALFSTSVVCPRCNKATTMRISDTKKFAYECYGCHKEFHAAECSKTISDYQNKDGKIVPLYQISLIDPAMTKIWYFEHKNELSEICKRFNADFLGCDVFDSDPDEIRSIDFGWEKILDDETIHSFTDEILNLRGYSTQN